MSYTSSAAIVYLYGIELNPDGNTNTKKQKNITKLKNSKTPKETQKNTQQKKKQKTKKNN